MGSEREDRGERVERETFERKRVQRGEERNVAM
jgi:hypothetical protein